MRAQNLVEDLEEDLVRVNSDLLTCVRRAVWGMVYAGDAATVSKSAKGVGKMMTVIVTVFEAAGLTASENVTLDRAAAGTGLGTSYLSNRHRGSKPEV